MGDVPASCSAPRRHRCAAPALLRSHLAVGADTTAQSGMPQGRPQGGGDEPVGLHIRIIGIFFLLFLFLPCYSLPLTWCSCFCSLCSVFLVSFASCIIWTKGLSYKKKIWTCSFSLKFSKSKFFPKKCPKMIKINQNFKFIEENVSLYVRLLSL